LLARLLNVFAMPGQVFEEVRVSRHSPGNWLVPTLLCCVALALSGYVVLSLPSVWGKVPELREQQAKALEEAVTAGKITRADADQSLQLIDSLIRPGVIKSFVVGAGLAYGVFRLFWWSLVLWLLARAFLRRPIAFGKAMEVAGLGSMIALLSTAVMLALTINIGESFGGTGFALAVTDISSSSHKEIARIALSIVNFWVAFVLGTGLARLTQVPWFRATFMVLVYWLLSDLLLALVGIGAGAR